MRRELIAICVLLAAASGISKAQGTDNEMESELGARVSIGADKRISQGFHWIAEGEARMDENFSDFSRYQLGTGLTWKATPWLKLGAGYIFILGGSPSRRDFS